MRSHSKMLKERRKSAQTSLMMLYLLLLKVLVFALLRSVHVNVNRARKNWFGYSHRNEKLPFHSTQIALSLFFALFRSLSLFLLAFHIQFNVHSKSGTPYSERHWARIQHAHTHSQPAWLKYRQVGIGSGFWIHTMRPLSLYISVCCHCLHVVRSPANVCVRWVYVGMYSRSLQPPYTCTVDRSLVVYLEQFESFRKRKRFNNPNEIRKKTTTRERKNKWRRRKKDAQHIKIQIFFLVFSLYIQNERNFSFVSSSEWVSGVKVRSCA